MKKNILLVAFLAVGILLVKAGALPLWAWVLLTAIAVVLRVVAQVDPYQDVLTITDQGVARRHGSRLRKQLDEFVRWDELRKVDVLANETGEGRKEMLFLLYGGDTNGVAVPGAVAARYQLADALQQRLPGFREDQLAQAKAATGRATFVVWERPA